MTSTDRRRRCAVSRAASSLALSFVVLSTPPPSLLHQLGRHLSGRCGRGGVVAGGGSGAGIFGGRGSSSPSSVIGGVMSVDQKKFRKCADTGFCRRNRGRTASTPASPFRVDPGSVKSRSDGITAKILPGDGGTLPLSLSVRFFSNGVCRLKVGEEAKERWEPPEVFLEEQLELAAYTLLTVGDPSLPPALKDLPEGWGGILASYGKGSGGRGDGVDYVLSVRFEPFGADLYAGGELAVSANRRGLMHFEQSRDRDSSSSTASAGGTTVDLHGGKKVVDYGEDGLAIYEDGTRETQEDHSRLLEEAARQGEDESGHGLWEESFDGHPDSKPDGPTSVGMDVYFPGTEHLYGIPEHASSMSLKPTTGDREGKNKEESKVSSYSEPYRLYTLDVFEYELDSPAALYGSIPVMLGHRAGMTSGVFWFNPTETFVDVEEGEEGEGKRARWISEGGALDVVMMPGPTPGEVFRQYAEVTGKPELPPLFSLGFHQCRWNYRDEQDVLTVDAGFEELDIPYDVIWLDIEHTDGKRYFTWDKALFPDPKRMIDKVAAHGRRMVTIVDPHIKRDNGYKIHKEATAKGLYIKDKDGKDFDGWCWPGQSSYLDFTDAGVRAWWASRFAPDQYEGSTVDLYTWNDMNEPSVFNGPEVSMKKDCLSVSGVEHRHWHNTYGMYMQRATAEGLELVRRGNSPFGVGEDGRPFVLSRSFFAGSQRWGAIWTGDNAARWDHLKSSAPMLLSMSVAGLPFVGADVGGFFGDPSAELFLRWMQAGAYQPFFRSHAHHDSKRREPWVFGEPWTSHIKSVIAARYSLLPYWYTIFQEASVTGMPMMRPMWVQYPTDPQTFDMDDQWMAGPDLLVKPVTSEGTTSVTVYFPTASAAPAAAAAAAAAVASCGDMEGAGECQPKKTGLWYDCDSMVEVRGEGVEVSVDAPLEKIPVFQRGGSIIPRKERLRRSSRMMALDPYTLVIALNEVGTAEGSLYLDDEESHDHLNPDGSGQAIRKFVFKGGVLSGRASEGSGQFRPPNTVERVVIAGVKSEPSSVTLSIPQESPAGKKDEGGGDARMAATESQILGFKYDATRKLLTVRKPHALVAQDWDMTVSYAVSSAS